jgi:hypothetical protein
MNELDVVRVKQTVLATPWFEDDPIEVKAGWEGTIVATPTQIRRALSSMKNIEARTFSWT